MRAFRIRGLIAARLLLALLIAATCVNLASAQSVADFYRGQTITLIVGANTGGGYDAYARPVSRHLGRFIPGEPNIVVKYMPAAGGLPAANSLYTVASKDGLTMGAVQRHTPFEVLRGNKSIVYDPFKFSWLGSLNSEVSVTMVWSTAPHRKAEDLLIKPLIVGSLGNETDSEIESNAMIRLLGAPLQVIRGYSGTAENLFALEKGEIQGLHGVSWSYVKTRKADWLKDQKIRVLLQTGLNPHPDLKDVATVYALVKSDEVRQVWDLILAPKVRSRPCAAARRAGGTYRRAALGIRAAGAGPGLSRRNEQDPNRGELHPGRGDRAPDDPRLRFSSGNRRQDGRRDLEQGQSSRPVMVIWRRFQRPQRLQQLFGLADFEPELSTEE
jgi:tripartite-type tricarboxylate transporter receptor subunit TctC